MVSAPVPALDDRVGGSRQFVVKPAGDGPAEHGLCWLLAVQRKA
jgi:hypothetical protein